MPDNRLLPLEEVVRRAEVIILGAPHAIYRDLAIPKDKIVVDIWGFWPAQQLATTKTTSGEARS